MSLKRATGSNKDTVSSERRFMATVLMAVFIVPVSRADFLGDLGVEVGSEPSAVEEQKTTETIGEKPDPLPTGIDKLKCPDVANLQEQAESLILRAITEQQSAIRRTKPAQSYEQDAKNPRGSRMKNQVRDVAKALVSAINNQQAAAKTASFALNGDAKRRATLKVYSQCYGEQIHTVIENAKFVQNIGQCNQGDGPVSVGINATQVFQTDSSTEQVQRAFVKKVVEPDETQVMSCESPCGAYKQRLPAGFPKSGHDYLFRTQKDFGFGHSMANETALRITKIPLCNSEFYLVSALGLPQRSGDRGFDSSALLGVVAPIGGKSLVFGSLAAQAYRGGGDKPMPIVFLEYHERFINDIFAKYNSIGSMIGSKERTVNGLIGGSPLLIPAARLTGPVGTQRTAQ
jgi:hypothetical protein